jgi:hypothetical protein
VNLRIADASGLVEFLYRTVSRCENRLLTCGAYVVVEVDGVLFYHSADPTTVGGPFQSLESLVRFEGMRRYPDSGAGDASADWEVFE